MEDEQDDRLYWVETGKLAGRCGPDLAPWDLSLFRQKGITGIVSFQRLRPSHEEAIEEAGFEHLRLYFPSMALDQSHLRKKFLNVVEEFFPFARSRTQEQDGKVLVHCHAGLDRSATALACYRIKESGLTAEEALEEMKEINPRAFITEGYEETVRRFAEQRRGES